MRGRTWSAGRGSGGSTTAFSVSALGSRTELFGRMERMLEQRQRLDCTDFTAPTSLHRLHCNDLLPRPAIARAHDHTDERTRSWGLRHERLKAADPKKSAVTIARTV